MATPTLILCLVQEEPNHQEGAMLGPWAALSETIVEPERDVDVDIEFDLEEKRAMEESAAAVGRHRPANRQPRIQHTPKAQDLDSKGLTYLADKKSDQVTVITDETRVVTPEVKLSTLLWTIYLHIPSKLLLLVGIVSCMVAGAMTPLFSWLLARLLFEVSIGAKNMPVINLYGGIVLCIAFANGFFSGLKYILMEFSALQWIQNVRPKLYSTVITQDKAWFDKPENKSERLVHVMFSDGEDAKELIATTLGQTVVVSAMLGLGLIWALIVGWQLTLAGFAIGPIFAGVMSVQATLVQKFQKQNHQCREDIAKGYYEVAKLSWVMTTADPLFRPSPTSEASERWRLKRSSAVVSTLQPRRR